MNKYILYCIVFLGLLMLFTVCLHHGNIMQAREPVQQEIQVPVPQVQTPQQITPQEDSQKPPEDMPLPQPENQAQEFPQMQPNGGCCPQRSGGCRPFGLRRR